MENKKGNVSTVFLVISIILIVVMGALLYMQKTEADRQIAELENNASKIQETINDLQGKIDTISNTINGTTEEIKFDVEIEMSELENVNYSDNAQLKTLEDKYKGKTVKITGYVSNFGDDDLEPGRTYVNIGNSTTYENKIYAGGRTYDNAVKAQINKLEKGQKISIVGVAFKTGTPEEGSWPIGLNDIKIIVEKEDNKNEIQYIEMTEDNHKKYNTEKYQFRYEDIINNNDKTITIKGRVYEEIELPIITKEQYQELMADKTIDLLGHKMKVSESNDFGGHDLLIESIDDWMIFYVDKNSDGTGTLMYGSEIALYKKTNTYMKITVDESIPTEGYSLKQLVGNNMLENQDSQELRMLPVLNDCYIFENGKCTSITFSTN